jgi:hypothetical protein
MTVAVRPEDRDRMDDDDALAPTVCGSPLRGRPGEYCGNPLGKNTSHPGSGRCWLHGGNSPVRHGRYSSIRSERLRGVLARVQQDQGDPLDLTPEVEMLRTLFVDFVERYDEMSEALLAWFDSYQARRLPPSQSMLLALANVVTEYEVMLNESPDEAPQRAFDNVDTVKQFLTAIQVPDTGRPKVILDISDANRLLSEVGRMVERIEKIRAANAISRPELNRIYHEMWRSVDARVTDDAAKLSIKNDWLRIAL